MIKTLLIILVAMVSYDLALGMSTFPEVGTEAIYQCGSETNRMIVVSKNLKEFSVRLESKGEASLWDFDGASANYFFPVLGKTRGVWRKLESAAGNLGSVSLTKPGKFSGTMKVATLAPNGVRDGLVDFSGTVTVGDKKSVKHQSLGNVLTNSVVASFRSNKNAKESIVSEVEMSPVLRLPVSFKHTVNGSVIHSCALQKVRVDKFLQEAASRSFEVKPPLNKAIKFSCSGGRIGKDLVVSYAPAGSMIQRKVLVGGKPIWTHEGLPAALLFDFKNSETDLQTNTSYKGEISPELKNIMSTRLTSGVYKGTYKVTSSNSKESAVVANIRLQVSVPTFVKTPGFGTQEVRNVRVDSFEADYRRNEDYQIEFSTSMGERLTVRRVHRKAKGDSETTCKLVAIAPAG